MKYILDENNNPVAVSLLEWAEWMDNTRRNVARTELGDLTVFTSFIGLDNGFPENPEKPLLWETMIKEKDDWWGYQERYRSHEDAIKGHLEALQYIIDNKGIERRDYPND